MAFKLHIDGSRFRDGRGREVTIHGINLGADSKNPSSPDVPSHEPLNFFDGDNVSFTNRPFSEQDAPKYFSKLRHWGFNTLRYIFTWEAIEHAGPGKYDEDFINHTIRILRLAKKFGFYVLMDPHQDVWSRFTGGSGAPMWTLYACGLNPRGFHSTQAALVQNSWPNPLDFPKMIWATNYNRLACQTVYTLFWAGRDFAPNAVIDGINIQDYLQSHFISACQYLAEKIKAAGDLEDGPIFAWESINEPNRCLVGHQDLAKTPAEQKLHKGTSPTPWQAILTGSGRACEVDTWDFGAMGPYKSGSQLIDPKGQTAWLPQDYDDSRYGWKRGPGWLLGECIWAQHGVWDPKSDALLRPDHFALDPRTGSTMDYHYFTNNYFLPHYREYRKAIRNIFPDVTMFCQSPVLELPASLKGTAEDDGNTVYAPHWYDGVTLMNKKWNRFFNVDVFGVLRGKYLSPAFALRFGETAIRNNFREQLSAIRDEGMQFMGERPTVFTEFGIPYDMDNGYAYRTGDYSSQTRAMDANYFGMEGAKVGNILWNFTATNQHVWGDQWNGEDLSIVSEDDKLLPRSPLTRTGSASATDANAPSYSESHASGSNESISSARKDQMRVHAQGLGSGDASKTYRAGEAYVRPVPVATQGNVTSYGFDLRKCEFHLELHSPKGANEDAPTEIFLPEYHFPPGFTSIEASGGKWTVDREPEERGAVQILKWWHAPGDQGIKVKGVTEGALAGDNEDSSYLSACREKAENCIMM